MPEMHLRQPGFTYSVCGPFKDPNKNTNISKKTEDLWPISQKELDKACFQHDMVYFACKNLPRKTVSVKVMHDNTLKITVNPYYDGY